MMNPVDFLCFTLLWCLPVNIMSDLKTEPRPFVSVITPAGAERARCIHRYGGFALIIQKIARLGSLFCEQRKGLLNGKRW